MRGEGRGDRGRYQQLLFVGRDDRTDRRQRVTERVGVIVPAQHTRAGRHVQPPVRALPTQHAHGAVGFAQQRTAVAWVCTPQAAVSRKAESASSLLPRTYLWYAKSSVFSSANSRSTPLSSSALGMLAAADGEPLGLGDLPLRDEPGRPLPP